MNSNFATALQGAPQIVYVRPVTVADLPEELRAQIGAVDVVYSVNKTDGERLALVRDRGMAFALARQHDLAPVSAH